MMGQTTKVQFLTVARINISHMKSVLQSTYSPIQSVSWGSLAEVKQLQCKSSHSLLSSAQAKDVGRYTSQHTYIRIRGANSTHVQVVSTVHLVYKEFFKGKFFK